MNANIFARFKINTSHPIQPLDMNPLLPAYVRPPPVAVNSANVTNNSGSGASPPFASVDLSLGSSVRNSHHSHIGNNASGNNASSTLSPKNRNSHSPFLMAGVGAGGPPGPTADQATLFGSRYVFLCVCSYNCSHFYNAHPFGHLQCDTIDWQRQSGQQLCIE